MRSPSEAQRLSFATGRKAPKFWLGKKQPRALVEKRISKIRGEKHWLWKGGKDRRDYRNAVTKENCEKCGSKAHLCIHHKDFDHYNDAPENLQVLCLSCHLSLHKTHYWDCYRKGIPHKKSNAPHHWIKRQ